MTAVDTPPDLTGFAPPPFHPHPLLQDQHVQTAEVRDALGDHLRPARLVANVLRQEPCGTWPRRVQLRGELVPGRLIDVGNHDPGAFADQCLRIRAAEAGGRTGNDRDLSIQTSHG
jgi:hypothetical protein